MQMLLKRFTRKLGWFHIEPTSSINQSKKVNFCIESTTETLSLSSGRSYEAAVKVSSVRVSAAGTYTFTFTLETGETYSADLVLAVIEKSK